MITEIKTIVKNYIDTIKLSRIELGTVVSDGVKINDKLTVPFDLVVGNLNKYIKTGDKVRLSRNLGGQEYYILEIVDRLPLLENAELEVSMFVLADGRVFAGDHIIYKKVKP